MLFKEYLYEECWREDIINRLYTVIVNQLIVELMIVHMVTRKIRTNMRARSKQSHKGQLPKLLTVRIILALNKLPPRYPGLHRYLKQIFQKEHKNSFSSYSIFIILSLVQGAASIQLPPTQTPSLTSTFRRDHSPNPLARPSKRKSPPPNLRPEKNASPNNHHSATSTPFTQTSRPPRQ